jgi:hypothetical protein
MIDINLIRNNPGLLTRALQARGMTGELPISNPDKLLRSRATRRPSSAEKCRRNGWKVGTRLAGDEGYGVTVIEITAVGEREVLAKAISHNGEPVVIKEAVWGLNHRKWRKVKSPGRKPGRVSTLPGRHVASEAPVSPPPNTRKTT